MSFQIILRKVVIIATDVDPTKVQLAVYLYTIILLYNKSFKFIWND